MIMTNDGGETSAGLAAGNENTETAGKRTPKAGADAAASSVTAAKAASADMQSLLAKRIVDLEEQLQTSEHRSREVAKRHKKALRDVQRIVADKTRSPEDVIEVLQERTLAAVNEAWKLEKRIPELEAKVEKLSRQSQADHAELEKSLVMRNKLQDLCRELQKQNKETQHESRLYQEAENAKRQKMVESVNTTVASITERLDQQAETIGKQAEENEMLREQLQRLMDSAQASELHGKKQAEAHGLERQIWEAKQQQQAEMFKKLEERGDVYAERYEMALKENELLSQQVQEYNSRFDEFKTALAKSNEMFDLLKNDAKSARVKERELLEKNLSLQQQYERAGMMLLRTTEEAAMQKEKIGKLSLANERLQSLCRAFQATKVASQQAPAGAASGEQDAEGQQLPAEQNETLPKQEAA